MLAVEVWARLLAFPALAPALAARFRCPGPFESCGFRLASNFFRLSISSLSMAISSCRLLSS